ncbi:MAG: hypothetical protein ACREM2_04620, partial [Vulcanimicrobiaceae bacterium]
RACAARFDATALLARDPWAAGLPLGGFVRLRDAESGQVARLYIDRAARARYAAAVATREAQVLEALARDGLRCAPLDAASSGEAALARAFAIA